MYLDGLVDFLRQTRPYQGLLEQLKHGDGQAHWRVVRSARPYLLACLARDWHAPILYLTARGKRAHNITEQLPVWFGEEDRGRVLRYADPTPMFYDHLAWDRDVIEERLGVLNAMMFAGDDGDKPPIIVASARGLMQPTLPPHQFRQATQDLKVGDVASPDKLMRDWLAMGYEAVTMVTQVGQFSRRGGILDVHAMAVEQPVRLEFFGDEIETIRAFDPQTQRTTASLTGIRIIPAREALPSLLPRATQHLDAWFASHSDAMVTTWQQDNEALNQGQAFSHLEYYLPYVTPKPTSLLDYASEDMLILMEDPDDLRETIGGIMADADNNRENNLKTNQLPPDYPLPYVSWSMLEASLEGSRTLNLAMTTEATPTSDEPLFKVGGRWGGQLRPFLADVRRMVAEGGRVVVVTGQVERLRQLWADEDASFVPQLESIESTPAQHSVVMVEGSLSEGWTLAHDGEALHLLSDAEIFNWTRPEPRRRQLGKQEGRRRLPESDYADWQTGDYVVHIDFGIGQFRGLQTRTLEGNEREYLMIEYAGTDMMFVPIHQADRLTRYVGIDERPPKLNKLGKPIEWLRMREKAEKSAEEDARELLEIYAKRAQSRGHAYAPDMPWQHELEASFPYIETEDQLRSIREVKADMETGMPMDRLVCGDVGYGKTEVALRAAFKAVMDGKQVAVLVPTTILAEQHYQTFSRRMLNFPVKVTLLSRFRTKAEQAKAIDELMTGKIDIVIGTHRLLSDDVGFANLGLVIIDEEQRFGVKHKEHFKKFRASVDVLTLTATPIPRTLYMSLSGVRDISMIQTPPEERLPIITHVGAFDEKLARQAILRELDRGGQVFIIHNRVRTIEMVREKFEQIVPEASIVVGHGQMSGRQLERTITDFGAGAYDILLATSIIENGIDMPNVNTLIIDRADWFGMSQLYQIRGRVGRGAQQAYAYFFHAGGRITEEAQQRLETLAEYYDLGAGFQVAVRDLEIRGTGDILSTRQSGHVAQVGLRLYTQLLQQAVKDLKDAPSEATSAPEIHHERIIIDLPIASYIPNDWIEEMALRLQLYRRISALHRVEDIEAIAEEMRDRFGVLPGAVEGLLYQIRVKLMASAIRATAIVKPREHILIKLPWLTAINREALAYALGEDIEVSRTAVELRVDGADLWQLRLLDVLDALRDGLPQTLNSLEGN